MIPNAGLGTAQQSEVFMHHRKFTEEEVRISLEEMRTKEAAEFAFEQLNKGHGVLYASISFLERLKHYPATAHLVATHEAWKQNLQRLLRAAAKGIENFWRSMAGPRTPMPSLNAA